MYGTYRQLKTGRRSASPELQFYRRPESPSSAGKSNGPRCGLDNNYYH
jgi:hypothetical protein